VLLNEHMRQTSTTDPLTAIQLTLRKEGLYCSVGSDELLLYDHFTQPFVQIKLTVKVQA
jgi:hypothetical protein